MNIVVNIILGLMLTLVMGILVLSHVRVQAADAPYVTLWTNGGPVSSANPLPAQQI
jgi:hypothetical protein